jgi:hypothetical protein
MGNTLSRLLDELQLQVRYGEAVWPNHVERNEEESSPLQLPWYDINSRRLLTEVVDSTHSGIGA